MNFGGKQFKNITNISKSNLSFLIDIAERLRWSNFPSFDYAKKKKKKTGIQVLVESNS